MQIEIQKNAFLELENISFILSHLDKLKINSINNGNASCTIDVDISYKDINDQECFKSLPLDISIDLDNIDIKNIVLTHANLFIVERKGIDIEYTIIVESEDSKNIEIIDITEDNVLQESMFEEYKEEEITKIKEDISKEYEEKLHDELSERNEVAVVKTKTKASASDFLSFFDNNYSSYYKIKTLECTLEELNIISKNYKIPYQELLYGYDRENGRVVFKLKE